MPVVGTHHTGSQFPGVPNPRVVFTLNGTRVLVYAGEIPMIDATENPRFLDFMKLADKIRVMKVRTNAETPEDAGLAIEFGAEGEITDSGSADNLCRTQVLVRLTDGGRVADLLRAPLGNHLVLVPGHHMNRLARWCRDAAIRVLPDNTRLGAEGFS